MSEAGQAQGYTHKSVRSFPQHGQHWDHHTREDPGLHSKVPALLRHPYLGFLSFSSQE